MPKTATKPGKKPDEGKGALGEVLSLAEAAAYLRVSEDDVLRAVRDEGLQGRQLGSEWRFLKAAIRDWLRGRAATLQHNKEVWRSLAGKYRDDPDLQRICDEAYRLRGRSGAGEE